MYYETFIDISAGAEQVWPVLTDVVRWPRWTKSMSSVERLDSGPFREGSKVRIKQPWLPTTDWTVIVLDELRCFTWVATAPGLQTTAEHRVEASGTGSKLTLSIRQDGALAPLAGLLLGTLTRHYVTMEAEGLKRACESRSE